MEKLKLVLKIILAVLVYLAVLTLYLWVGSLITGAIFSTNNNLAKFVFVIILYALISSSVILGRSIIKNEAYKGGN